MNGELVGVWSRTRAGGHRLTYEETWLHSPRRRSLSLSLPIGPSREITGSLAAVEKRLASDFPRIPWERISNGMLSQADAFKNEILGWATPGNPAAAAAAGFLPGERLP
ncbi:MAG: hypothetical protein IPI44_18490 [Sulfuritalea sp.]|nr:hypothetical protein [Sulfuritalea sp.]MBK8118633.1 hypothetical protein [Sulfuritalea sp.]